MSEVVILSSEGFLLPPGHSTCQGCLLQSALFVWAAFSSWVLALTVPTGLLTRGHFIEKLPLQTILNLQ